MGHSALTPIWDIFRATSPSLLSHSKTPISVVFMLNHGSFSSKRRSPIQIHPTSCKTFTLLWLNCGLRNAGLLSGLTKAMTESAHTLLAGPLSPRPLAFRANQLLLSQFFPEAPALCKSTSCPQTSCPPAWIHLKCPAPYARIAGSSGLQRPSHTSIPRSPPRHLAGCSSPVGGTEP